MYDIAIIGGGPCGLAAGLYGARGGMRCVLVEGLVMGGQITRTTLVENYPGFPDGIDGFAIGINMEKQAVKFGLEVRRSEVTGLELGGEVKRVRCAEGALEARAVIIATGASPQKLGLPREEELTGAGVSYCATCDGAFFRGADVAVVGGGDTALSDALYLAKFVNRVYLIHRRDELRAASALQRAMLAEPKIEFVKSSIVTALMGADELDGIAVRSLKDESARELSVAGLFVAVGVTPNTALVEGQLSLDERGRIATDRCMRTSLPLVYAAGDVRDTPLRQVITAAADGAVAATTAIEDLMK